MSQNIVISPAPIVNLEKTPGQAASGRIGINFVPGNVVQEETIRISGPVLNLSGTADFNNDGEMDITVASGSTYQMWLLQNGAVLSTTTPLIDDVAPPCAHADTAEAATKSAARNNRNVTDFRKRVMRVSPGKSNVTTTG